MSKDIFTEPARFSLNLKGAAYLGAYQQNHLVRMPDTHYVDFTDIPAKSPRAKCVHLLRVRPRKTKPECFLTRGVIDEHSGLERFRLLPWSGT